MRMRPFAREVQRSVKHCNVTKTKHILMFQPLHTALQQLGGQRLYTSL